MLKALLQHLYQDSQAIKNRPVRKTLQRGLRIMMLNSGSELVLVLSRNEEYPSVQEWETVRKHMPFPVAPELPFERVLSDHRPSLRARLPVPKTVQIPMFQEASRAE